MREIRTHQLNPANAALVILAVDNGGPQRTCYEVHGFPGDPLRIEFLSGKSQDGITNEVLLAIVMDRLQGFQAGEWPCVENDVALQCLRLALLVLKKRAGRIALTGFSLAGAGERDGVDEILCERITQLEKGYGPEHDDDHWYKELATNAADVLTSYLGPRLVETPFAPFGDGFGLGRKYNGQPLKLLAIAGALCAAEFDRLQRQQAGRTEAVPANEVDATAGGGGNPEGVA